jgi:hypothetical protein
MAQEPPELHDHSFYEPLFEPITAKLRETGGMDLEILISELLPVVGADYDGDDIEAAIVVLETKGLVRREALDGEAFIELIE